MKPIYVVLYIIGGMAVFSIAHIARDQVVMRAATSATGETPAQYEASKQPATSRSSNVFDQFDPHEAQALSVAGPHAAFIDPYTKAVVCGAGYDAPDLTKCIPACGTGFHHSDAPDRACLKDPDYFTNRTVLGSCPTGYVDNPRDPATCALPWIAAKMLKPAE